MSAHAPATEEHWALFLDVDGTLLEIAPTPQAVRVSEELKELLHALWLRLDGALALVSGRSLADLDALFAPLRFCASGVHGCERRDATGCVIRPAADLQALAAARSELTGFVQEHAGLLLEDKGYGLAVHFRRAPHLATSVHDATLALCERLGCSYTLQAGKYVYELRPAGSSKGTAIAAFMQEPPFRDRTPIFLGDDVTDEDGFAVVNALGGVSIKVGAEPAATLAQRRLPAVAAVIRWLARLRNAAALQALASEN